MSWVSDTQASLQGLLNVTADSLAEYCGLTGNQQENSVFLERQLGLLQRNPSQSVINSFYLASVSEFCAKYLPTLVDAYNAQDAAFSVPMRMLNVVAYLPYFTRFLLTTAKTSIYPTSLVEMCQFLSTLLALEGPNPISEEDKQALLPKLREWDRKYQRQQITRCLKQLEGDPETTLIADGLKQHCERSLNQCGFDGCGKSGTSKLLQCSRCKTAVYCDRDHQKKSWPFHKATCFPAAF
ncbi:uncharacterized protein BJ212DRAFT_437622 [Suillus subaureus]|uniref:MYND-type domain-containing protein n=1 Tax=Suillus subaureus TaxID=48587 RepID=A0A9P7E7E5_9AGAM|nr:uncharacterized protein BJ212DRAFT_437622 [Suillus subaureus]KAG1812874.1 hypothetical protein BJ212DRAFT_437622 [Suillus subaureus]